MLHILVVVIAGLTSHLCIFKHGEWHLWTRPIGLTYTTLSLALLWISKRNGYTLAGSIHWVACVGGCYFSALFASMIIYRLLFHPLSNLPGPKLAAVSKMWHVYHSRHSTNHILMEDMHRRYGQLVRTGPNEISIFHPAGIELLDGAKNTNSRDAFYDVIQPRSSVIFTRDGVQHRERRMMWSHAFSTKSMDEYKPRVAALARDLKSCIDSYGDQPVNMTDVMTWYSFDIMGEVIFGKDFGMIKNRATNPILEQQRQALALLGPIIDVQWIVHLAFNFVPFIKQVQDWMKMCSFCEQQMVERMATTRKGNPDLASWFIDEYNSAKGIDSEEERKRLLDGNTVSAVIAGSDTNRAALTASWWFLAKHTRHASKIQDEIRDLDPFDTNSLAQLPHLNAVINEVLRLLPPAMTGLGRMTGPEGLLVDDILIPPGVRVTAPRYVIQRLECAFEHAADFIPERWYSRPELVRDKSAFTPFSVGPHQCVGKSLALVELRLAIAVLLKDYDVSFAQGYDPNTMWQDLKDQVTAQPGRVSCNFKTRKS